MTGEVNSETLWEQERIFAEIADGDIGRLIPEPGGKALRSMAREELHRAVGLGLQRPQSRDIPHSQFVRRGVHAAQYRELFELWKLPRELAVYEPCAGGSYPVVLATEAHSGGSGEYATVNLNRRLRAELEANTGHLGLAMRVVDGNAMEARAYFPTDCFDAACFHHAINDILQTAVSEPRGMDTATLDWWPNERQMIEWLAEDFASGGLEEQGRPELLQIIAAATELVRPGGYLMFDHWAWLGHREENWFPWELFCDLIPMARRWITASSLPLKEVQLSGAEPQWWMFFRVEK